DRMVVRPDGELAVGRTLPGRGVWLCRGSLTCFDAAVRRKALGWALRTPVGSEALASLRATLVNRARMSTPPIGRESTAPGSTDDAHVEQTKDKRHRKD